ncbi:TonB-dependent receptor [Frateuria sp.]|uniref:TonB-dependent receptor n=1 Tax=Frateuria sp. TaxID=2211372 RepID=UPI0017A1E06A|nr:TonB-dependent receptor [Frateuria sp.]NUR21672.1 TonB-dependent receptor [Frateuria sp.]
MNKRYNSRGVQPRRTALTVALAMGLGFTGFAYGQATTGSIFGTAPVGVGETVMVQGANGTNREVAVDSSGRYSVTVPVGRYTVTLRKDGQVLATQENVGVSPGGGTQVPFAAATAQNAQNLSAVQVVASALPAIDVTSVNSSTIITAADLAKLPVSRSAESIALLAPSTAKGSSYFPNAVAFGGSSVSENAYYVNGYTTGAPYKNIGGFQLPYGSIDQQETLTGGYDAKYGRSDGGVINQIGKRGTNEWHFGAQVAWEPRFLEASPRNTYYPHQTVPGPAGPTTYQLASPELQGTLDRYRNDNKQWETIYSAYVGGPLIKDKLFLFLAGETTKTHYNSVQTAVQGSVSSVDYNRDKHNKFYGKLDWNITDNNVLELTALKDNQTTGAGSTYNFDYNKLQATTFRTPNDVSKNNAAFYIGHFTSYITDNATLSVLYGKGEFENPTTYSNTSTLPMIAGSSNIPAAKLPAGGYVNPQTNRSWFSGNAKNGSHGLRVDFDYKLGDHDLAVGIDNMHYAAKNQGPSQYNPFDPSVNYFWSYRANGTVRKYSIGWATSMSTDQKAYYLQDTWQVSSNVLLKVGLRNDHFINYNDVGQAFVDEKNQWEPRIGASWDVNGDSSFKIYGNVGRYYLALPENAAERAANTSTYIYQIYNYTSVDATGQPQGLTSPDAGKLHSPDGEFGLPKDPEQVTARNLKAEYMDEFIAGFDKKLNENWTYGAKAMWRDLKTAIDDECSPGQIATKMAAMGLNSNDYSNSLYGAAYCRLINPGETNTMLIRANAGSGQSDKLVSMTQQDWGYTQGVKRKVGSLNLYLEHPFDGKWQARVDYTYTRGFGNTEGQVRSDFGQSDVSKTEDWDAWQLMDGQNGELFNVRKHQLRIRGAYQFTPEWLVSGTLLAQSGVPQECLGYYGPNGNEDPVGYGSNYHWCAGKRITPGFKHTPWTKEVNLGVHYTPAFADHKLGINLDVFNAFNQQKATQTDPTQDADVGFISATYGMPLYYQTPRTFRLTVT